MPLAGIRTPLLFLSLAFLYGGASFMGFDPALFDTEKTNTVRVFLVGGGFLGVFFCFLRAPRTVSRGKRLLFEKILVVWAAFGLATVVASTIKSEWGMLEHGLWFLFGVPFFFFWAVPFAAQSVSLDLFLKAFFVGHLPYLATFYYSPLDWNALPYAGIWENPNTFGIMGATLMVGPVYFAHRAFKKDNQGHGLFWSSLGVLFFVLILLSGSRTAMMAGIFLFTLLVMTSKLQRRGKAILFFVAPLLCLLIFFSQSPTLNPMKEKFALDATNEALIPGRTERWKAAIEDASWVGHARGYFKPVSAKMRVGSGHNSFIDVLGLHGIVASLALVLFFGLSWQQFSARRRSFDGSFQFAFVAIFFVFTIFSLTEAMLGALGLGIQLLFLTMVGMLSYKLRQL